MVARVQDAGASEGATYVPWIHGQTKEKLFICDVMLEGLARQMRLFGLDVISMQQRDKRFRASVVRCFHVFAQCFLSL